MSPDIENLVQLAVELEDIATTNGDEFRVRLDVFPGSRFELSCVERVDSHEFVSASGTDLNAVIEQARAGIDDACKSWGYKRA